MRLGAAERDPDLGRDRDWETAETADAISQCGHTCKKKPQERGGSFSWSRLECGVLRRARKREEGAGSGTSWSGLEPLGLGNICMKDKEVFHHYVCMFN